VIVVSDGDVREVLSDGVPVEVIVVDYDTDDDDPEDLLPIPEVEDGELIETDALAVRVNVEVNPERVEQIHAIVNRGAAPGST
jgi:uncharacterized membrane protein